MYVSAYLRFNFKTQDFVTKFSVKAQIRTQKNVKCVHIIKCAEVCALFAKNKVRFARAERWFLEWFLM